MANTTIRLRKSGVASNVPNSLDLGELALNYADGKLYYKNALGTITYISSGATTNSFATINSNSSLILATSNTDILSLGGANGINITTDTINKVITINGRALENRIIHLENWDDAQNDIVSAISSEAFLAHDTANLAYNQANSATTLAQSAYNYANTLSGGATPVTVNYLTIEKQLYTANANQTNFYAQYTPPFVTVVINGSTVDASEYSTATANTVILNNPASAGDIIDITGFNTFNANTFTPAGGSGTDQWVRDTANSATANTIVTQGVDAYQNTQITYVNSFVATAYTQANNANNLAQSAYNKANNALPLTGGTLTGSLSISGNNDLTVTGNLYVTGTQYISNTQSFVTNDPLLVLGLGNYTTDLVDIGFAAHYNDGSNAHTGLVRDFGTKEYYFFKGYTPELDTNNNIDINHATFSTANVNADYVKGNLIATTITVGGRDYQSVNDTQNTNITTANNAAWAAFVVANTNTTNITAVNGYAASAYNIANISYNTAASAYSQANNAYTQANGANNLAAGAYNKANNAFANTTGTFAGDLTTTGNIIISNATSSYSVGTGSLRVNGGVGVTGNVYADKIYVNGLFWAANGNVISTGGSTSGTTNQFNIYKYIATNGQTTFSGLDSSSVSLNYTVGAVIVTLNGLTLKPGTDYTAIDGSSIILAVAADLNDELNIYGFTSTTVNTSNTLSVFSYTATASQTSFGGVDTNGNSLGYVPGNLFTTLNGITLRNGVDYTAANGSYINLTFNAAANDEVVVYTFGAFNVANTYTITQADAKFTSAGKSLAINFFRS
jgi:hypothetical protein